ncbi:hypothetical protein CI088_00750, partial [Enterococcus plantarum]
MLGGGHLNQVVDLLVEVAQVFRAETIHLVSPALYSSQTDLISAEHKDRIKNGLYNILCWWKSKKIFYQHFFEHLNTKKEQLTDKMKSTKTTNHQKGCSLWIRIPDYCSDL